MIRDRVRHLEFGFGRPAGAGLGPWGEGGGGCERSKKRRVCEIVQLIRTIGNGLSST